MHEMFFSYTTRDTEKSLNHKAEIRYRTVKKLPKHWQNALEMGRAVYTFISTALEFDGWVQVEDFQDHDFFHKGKH